MSRMGYRRDPVTGAAGEWHNGTDLAIPVGTPIVALGDGIVSGVYLDHALSGTALVIDHRPAGLPFLSSYVHLSALRSPDGTMITGAIPAFHAAQLAAKLKGARVQRGQVIGLSGGQPGTWGAGKTTGPHLHLRLQEWDGSRWQPVESVDRIDWRGVNLVERVHGPRSTP